MYIVQYSSFCIHLKYPQNEYGFSSTYPEMSSPRDESKHTFSQDSSALWGQCTSVRGDCLDSSIPVTEHHVGLKTGSRRFHCLILLPKSTTSWSQSFLLLVPCSISHWNIQSFPHSPASDSLQTSQIFLQTLQHTVCNSGKKKVFTKYLKHKLTSQYELHPSSALVSEDITV